MKVNLKDLKNNNFNTFETLEETRARRISTIVRLNHELGEVSELARDLQGIITRASLNVDYQFSEGQVSDLHNKLGLLRSEVAFICDAINRHNLQF